VKVAEFTTIGPLDVEPSSPYIPLPERREVFADALRGVDLGDYDKDRIEWMLRTWDISIQQFIVSLFERVRQAGLVDLAKSEVELARQQGLPRVPLTADDEYVARERRMHGNSGPGGPL
jgi:hypothetical protein